MIDRKILSAFQDEIKRSAGAGETTSIYASVDINGLLEIMICENSSLQGANNHILTLSMAVDLFIQILIQSGLPLDDKVISAFKTFFDGYFMDAVQAKRKRISERKAKLS